jgi:predicted nucleotidyltransferase
MNTGDSGSELLAALEESVCSDSDVVFGVTFGSQITNKATSASDLDLAVKFADELPASDRFDTRCFLSGDLQREDAPFLDVSDIESLPMAVAHDAVNGVFVCGDEHAFERFKTNVEAPFAEQCDTLRRQQRGVIDRMAEDGLHG